MTFQKSLKRAIMTGSEEMKDMDELGMLRSFSGLVGQYKVPTTRCMLLFTYTTFVVLSKSTRNNCDVGVLSTIGRTSSPCSVRHFESCHTAAP